MASIENRSRFSVTVPKQEDFTKSFAYTREKEAKSYIAELKAAGYKPKLSRTDDSFAIRVREAGHRRQCRYASSLQEAIDIQQRVEVERRKDLFVDHAKGRSCQSHSGSRCCFLREVSPSPTVPSRSVEIPSSWCSEQTRRTPMLRVAWRTHPPIPPKGSIMAHQFPVRK